MYKDTWEVLECSSSSTMTILTAKLVFFWLLVNNSIMVVQPTKEELSTTISKLSIINSFRAMRFLVKKICMRSSKMTAVSIWMMKSAQMEIVNTVGYTKCSKCNSSNSTKT